MDELNYTINNRDLTIYPPKDDSGQYLIKEEGIEIGHLFIDGINEQLNRPYWKGTTTEVNLYADELGAFIEQCELS